MNFNKNYNEIIKIFTEELPKKNKLPIEIIRKILFNSGYKIIHNINFIKCFNEFNNLKLYTNDNKELSLDYNKEIKVKSIDIHKGKYQNCKKINKLILLRIFNFRKNNNITNKIFIIKLTYNGLYNNERIIELNREYYICE